MYSRDSEWVCCPVVTWRMGLINVRQEKVNFIFLRLHILNTCWQVLNGKIKLPVHINESRCIYFEEPFKSSILFEFRTICTHLESLVYTVECNLERIIKCISEKVKNLI